MSDETGPSTSVERFEPRTETVRDARRFVARVLASAGEVADDAALLVSELATNAVIHAGSTYTVTVTVREREDVVRVEVADASPASARRCRYSPTSGTGRGLGMVEDLSSEWGVESDNAGKVVWFELPLRSGRPSGAAAASRPASGGDDHAATDADLDALLADLGGWDDEVDDGDALPPSTPSSRSLLVAVPSFAELVG